MASSYVDKLYAKKDELLDRLDNLEGCEDNPIYKKEIEEIRAELEEVQCTINTELF